MTARIPDPIEAGMKRGWRVIDASLLEHDRTLEADVVIVGSGAGGGISAEILARSGLSVIVVEEGPLKSSRDFKMREADAYPDLYQESAARKTADKAINILQGRAVGGSTTVNWTSSFRTPDATLAWWRRHYALAHATPDELAPWFAMAERRTGVVEWLVDPNQNNDVLRRGAAKLGIATAAIRRNVQGCWNLGYCGMGCPTNAKQSMLVTTIPATLEKGGELLYLARAERLMIKGDKVVGLQCLGMDERCVTPNGRSITVRAKHYVLAGGGINSPALLLRSDAPDPHKRVGKRTFLHLTSFSAAQFDRVINPFYGAPQSIYSDHFQWTDGTTGQMSYKLEVPPLQPALASTLLGNFGQENAERMAQLPKTHMMLALMRDGFHPDSVGGNVELRGDGTPVLDYQVTPYAWDGIRRAYRSMAEIQFAGGAKSVMPVHEDARYVKTMAEATQLINGLSLETYRTRLGSAHVMGGCAMGDAPDIAVCDSLGRHHQLSNLSIHDGSLFPTSIGANPQLSVYGLTAQLATALSERLKSA